MFQTIAPRANDPMVPARPILTGIPRIALVGGGPTSLYALQQLIEHDAPLEVHILEKESHIGPGMPYRDDLNDPAMLANIAGRELPALTEPLHDWLASRDAETLAEMGLRRHDISAETFFPRVVLGRYFTAQFARMVARGRAMGHVLHLRTRHAVRDICVTDRVSIDWQTPNGPGGATFDHVVLATGHEWPKETTASGITMQAPWPVDGLRACIGRRVGVLGTSLTAIDAAVALAGFHGDFVEEGASVRWTPHEPLGDFHITLMSRKGLLPPADWYYTLPLPELRNFNPDTVADDIAQGEEGLLPRCLEHLAQDLIEIDDPRARALDLTCVEGLADRFFAERLTQDAWEASRMDLKTALSNRAVNRPDPWRMALLRAHEVFESAIPHMSQGDRALFGRELTPIFTDCYASVPHRSIRRILALKDVGVLDLMRLGTDYAMTPAGNGVQIDHAHGSLTVDRMVDARGQRPTDFISLFPGLTSAAARLDFDPVTCAVSLPKSCRGSLSCLSIPVLLPTDPFVQGLERARDLGRMAAQRILSLL